ncbi:MAG: regulatory protein RecX [Pseudomonadota bacterium]
MTQRKTESPDDPLAVRDAALRLLGRRDHSTRELCQKLCQRGFEAALVDQAVAELVDAGLHSEQRFAESYARMRANKAYGPVRIRAELVERGVDRHLISLALDALDIDFAEQARRFYERKYRTAAASYQEKARRNQSMARRGFTADQIKRLMV